MTHTIIDLFLSWVRQGATKMSARSLLEFLRNNSTYEKIHRSPILWILLTMLPFGACTTLDSSKELAHPPQITKKMPLTDAIHAGLTFGDKTLHEVKKLISKRQEWPKTAEVLRKLILDQQEEWPAHRLINAFSLYQTSNDPKAPQIFQTLSRSDRRLSQQLVWTLAAQLPSPEMAKELETRLTEAIMDNEVNDLLTPQLADAVAANHLKDSYTIVRQGLFATNHVSFARAMSQLNPVQATGDFLEYLSQAPIEELRQLNVQTVDALTCLEILTQLRAHPPSLGDPKIETIFFFAISRNVALSEAARLLINVYLPKHSGSLAVILSQLPAWIQLAYVEGVRRQYTASQGLFLGELKKISAQKEVVEEIDQIPR